MSLSTEHLAHLSTAKALLANGSLSDKIGALFGVSVDSGYARLPQHWETQTAVIAQDALLLCLRGMLTTLGGASSDIFPTLARFSAAIRTHERIAELPGLALELPVSMMLLCRSVADIARANGERSEDLDTRLACLELFALGDARRNAMGAGYFALRATLASPTAAAIDYLNNTLMVDEEDDALRGYIAVIAKHFREQIEIHVAAEASPGASTHYGSAVNLLLIDHFQDIARGHFTVRRLERVYGQHEVRATYDRIRLSDG
jgi:EcsC protein family